MSRDFSPRECWIANDTSSTNEHPYGIWLENVKWTINGHSEWTYSDEELQDRRNHKYLAVLGCDIYSRIRSMLDTDSFENLNRLLNELVDADFGDEGTSAFPKKVTDWYYNRHGHYYREPNDEEFLEYIIKEFGVRES